jgi:hypothetical protein
LACARRGRGFSRPFEITAGKRPPSGWSQRRGSLATRPPRHREPDCLSSHFMAIYNRLTLVITVKEELLHPRRETNERAAWYEVRESHIAIADSDGTWLLGVYSNCACKTTETRGLLSSSSSDRFGSNNTARKPEPPDVERESDITVLREPDVWCSNVDGDGSYHLNTGGVLRSYCSESPTGHVL